MTRTTRVLAIASSGGHWIQLRRLRPAWEGCDVAYVTTDEGYREECCAETGAGEAPPRFYCVTDANRWQRLRLMRQLVELALVLLRERPDVVVSTGAAPGYLALRLGKWLGARTAWVDSIANAQELSLSGRLAGRCADLWLTQWEHLAVADPAGRRAPRFEGRVTSFS